MAELTWKKGTQSGAYEGPNDYYSTDGRFTVMNYGWTRTKNKYELWEGDRFIKYAETMKDLKAYAETI